MRIFAAVLLLCGAFVGYAPVQDNTPRLYVYLPSNIRPFVMQKRLQEACPGLSITVFGHHREMSRAVRTAPPEAILSLEPVVSVDRYDMFTKTLLGERKGKRFADMVLLSREKRIETAKLAEISIGVVDILGRSSMREMLGEMIDVEQPRIRPVSRLEDLIALLQVNEAEAVLVEKDRVDSYYRERTGMELVVNEIPNARMGLPTLSINERATPAQRDQLVKALTAMNKEMNTRLGVDAWVKP